MTVSTTQPFQIVFSLFQHQYLGYLFNIYAVQLDAYRRLTLQYQTISKTNAEDFGLQEADYELVELIESMQHEAIIKKYAHKKVPADVFFLKVYDKENGDKILQEAIGTDVENKRSRILEKLQGRNKLLFEMSNDGVPTYKKIDIETEKAKVLFHFFRNKENTHYFPTLKHKDKKLEFKYKNAVLICNNPAYLLLEDHLYSFEKNLDGKKLQPFLHKNFIEIPRKIEDTYFRKFVAPLIEDFDVHAEGFEIRNATLQPNTVVTFAELPKTTKLSLLDTEITEQNISQNNSTNSLTNNSQTATQIHSGNQENTNQEESKIVFNLCFQYNDFLFGSDNTSPSNVQIEKRENDYIFHRVLRNQQFEIQQLNFLQNLDLAFKNGKVVLEKSKAFSWISQNIEQLINEGISLKQSNLDTKKYFIGTSTINLQVKENKDWFDVYAIIHFGEYEIPFLQIRKMILQKIREFTLPNGEIAVIPDVWFLQYHDIFNFIDDRNNENKLKKHHLGLLQDLQSGSFATLTMNRKLEKLRDFEQIDSYELPKGFVGDLRPYQKSGYDWLRFLADFNFGGCLADDMGLGKTVQTLAMLQAQKEINELQNIKQASLLIMPTSLIYNWQKEAMKFTPELKVLNYTGGNRNKNVQAFDYYDLIITSYGTARIDAELLEKYYFNYIILDESQAIKNPEANTTKALRELNSKFRLILTGTPIENTTMDLWSQMSFINGGLLGSLSFFRNEFQLPIEKKNDIEKLKKLHIIIKPFILRRLKTQVAKDLPEKTINVKYCKMTDEQEKRYEEVKSHYRNKILEHIETKGIAQSQMVLIQGLTQLRQIANHPKMVDTDYKFDSGKLEDMLYMLETAVSEGHKVLIFSQFVKHLTIVKQEVEKLKIRYAYLDGNTTDRQEQVELFQNDKKVQVFLISLKAGGVGLNLTAADYVFLLDPWWNPAAENQAIDRSHRIGQKQHVIVYKFITQNTVEEKILLMQQGKIRLANDLISNEDGFMKSLDKADIELLLQ
jgi:SNF2 family DNA or RNA helicase